MNEEPAHTQSDPGPPPGAPPRYATVGQDERNMAGASHLSVFVPYIGLLVAIGIWIYAHTRNPRQAFASFQAAQATLFQVIVSVLLTIVIGFITLMFVGIVALGVMTVDGDTESVAFSGVVIIGVFLLMGIIVLASLAMYGYAIYLGVRCFQGRNVRIPLISYLAAAISPPPADEEISSRGRI